MAKINYKKTAVNIFEFIFQRLGWLYIFSRLVVLALEVRSRRGAIQIHVYLYVYLYKY